MATLAGKCACDEMAATEAMALYKHASKAHLNNAIAAFSRLMADEKKRRMASMMAMKLREYWRTSARHRSPAQRRSNEVG